MQLRTALVLLGTCAPAAAQISVGPWTFHDDAFADAATQIDTGAISLWCSAADLSEALTGFSPSKQIVNVGFGGNGNQFQLDFVDLQAVNAPGPDLVFFEQRFSADPYELAVRPVGGAFTPFLTHAADAFQFAGQLGNCGAELWGVGVELDDYGLPANAVVDALQFRALPKPGTTTSEGDPVMAAVLNDVVVGLEGDPPLLSVGAGGAQTFQLVAGADYAGLPYLLLGSLSGTEPGFPIDGLWLPLNVDAYTIQGLLSPNTPPLNNSFGTLDANGSATALFQLPSGLPGTLAGLQVHHAYVVLELTPSLLSVVYVSNAVALALAL